MTARFGVLALGWRDLSGRLAAAVRVRVTTEGYRLVHLSKDRQASG